MAKNPGIKLTANSFGAIEKALDNIIKKAEEATQKITAMFDIDGTNMKTLQTLRDIKGKLDEINKSMNRSSAGGGGGKKGGRKTASGGSEGDGWLSQGYNRLFRYQQQAGFYRWLNSMAFKTMFGGPGGLGSSLRGGNFLGLNLSKYGPGTTGLMAKYRVFQKPFPGSDRNVFSLGDLAAAGQNIAYGAGSGLEGAFRGLTGSATAVSKVLNGMVSSFVSFFSPMIGSVLGSVGDLFIGMLEKMSSAIAGVIGGLTNLGTALVGMATRAVEAASDLTEAVNAARVIAGDRSAREMQRYALGIQRQFGLSQTDSMKIMGRMAGMMRNLGGFSQDEAGQTSMQLYRAAVDIGSVMNKSVEDIGNQLMSGFAGRLTPLRRSAIGITAQQLDQQAKARGIARPGVRTDLQARARQFVEEFSRQAGLFTGDLERTQYEFANQRRKFLGQFEALFVTVGRILEPFAKAIIIAANDLMGMVLDIISPFANTIKDNMVEMTVMERFSESIKTFAWYVLWAKNAMIELIKRVWEARSTIGEWMRYLADAAGTMAVSLIKFSSAVVEMFATLISRLGGAMPAIDLFASALVGVADWINRNILGKSGTSSVDKRILELSKSNQAMGRMLADNPNAAVGNSMSENRKMIEALTPYSTFGRMATGREPISTDIMPDDLRAIVGIGPRIGAVPEFMKGFSGTLQTFAAQVEATLKEMGIKVKDAEIVNLMRKIQPATSFANPLAPAPDMNSGRLVQYFNPAAFRDAIQEREGSPMKETAKNTSEILTLLQTTLNGTLKGNIRPKAPFNMLSPVTLP